jgi:hypothetical protein
LQNIVISTTLPFFQIQVMQEVEEGFRLPAPKVSRDSERDGGGFSNGKKCR